MICILKMDGADITGWILATDVHDARRQAHAMMSAEGAALASELYTMEFPQPGNHVLRTGHIMLVS